MKSKIKKVISFTLVLAVVFSVFFATSSNVTNALEELSKDQIRIWFQFSFGEKVTEYSVLFYDYDNNEFPVKFNNGALMESGVGRGYTVIDRNSYGIKLENEYVELYEKNIFWIGNRGLEDIYVDLQSGYMNFYFDEEMTLPVPIDDWGGSWYDYAATDYASGARDLGSKTLTISTAEELALFAIEQNDKFYYDRKSLYDGWKVLLGEDIDLSAHIWSPLYLGGVTFDGQGKTIFGMYIASGGFGLGEYYPDVYPNCFGLFGYVKDSIISDIVLDYPVINRRYAFDAFAGSIAGLVEGGRIIDCVVNEPSISIDRVVTSCFLGGVAGMITKTDTPIPGKQPIAIVMGTDVNGGVIEALSYTSSSDSESTEWYEFPDIFASGSVGYYGGIVGANIASLASNNASYGLEIRSSAKVDWFDKDKTIGGMFAGGIAGYSSMTDLPLFGTCLLNNISMTTINIEPELKAGHYYVGGVCGLVKNDDIVNNLYIGNQEIFGKVDNESEYTVDFNVKYANINDAWNAEGGNGALYKKLGTEGLYAAGMAVYKHRGGNFADCLSKLMTWAVDAETHIPYFDKYYNPDEFVLVTDITGVPTEMKVGDSLTLLGTVVPSNASQKNIVWGINKTGTTAGATMQENVLKATSKGKIIVTASVIYGTNFTKDFEITVTSSAKKPAKVAKLKAISKKKKKAVVSWKKNKTNTKGYEVFRSLKKKKGFKKVKTLKGTKFTNKKLKSNKVYYYKVRAYNLDGKKKVYGNYSAVKKVRIK